MLFTTVVFAQIPEPHPPGHPYLYDRWYWGSKDATMSQAFKEGIIRYYIKNDLFEFKTSDLILDFETAIRTWLIAIDRSDIHVGKAESIEDADLLLHFGNTTMQSSEILLPNAAAIFFPSVYEIRKNKIVPIIELRPDPMWPWISLREALEENGVVVSLDLSSNHLRKRVKALEAFTGSFFSPEVMARQLLRTNPVIQSGKAVGFRGSDDIRRLVLSSIMHELGHVFGLNDLFRDDTQENLAHFLSIMGNARFKPMVPSTVDRRRVRAGLISVN